MEDKTNITKITLYYKGVQVIKVYPEELKADRLEKIVDSYLDRNGWKPSWSEDTNKQVDPDWIKEGSESWCPIHKIEMKKYEKEGRSWYSHMVSKGNWCNGKEK